jgi:polar amino acid transport system ATP-binding protein
MNAVVSLRDLRLRRGTRNVLAGITLDIEPRDIVAIMGMSGAGKTSLLRVVAGLESFDAGDVRLPDAHLSAGSVPTSADLRRLSRQVGLVFQFHHLFEHLSAIDNVTLAPVHVQGVARHTAEARARQLLDDLGVGERAGALPRELSGGEAQRVAIARALALDPPLLLLDEPTASLDPARRNDLTSTLRQLADRGRALLVTSHDVAFVRETATVVLVLAEGVIVERGRPDEILSRPSHPATRQLLAAEHEPSPDPA